MVLNRDLSFPPSPRSQIGPLLSLSPLSLSSPLELSWYAKLEVEAEIEKSELERLVMTLSLLSSPSGLRLTQPRERLHRVHAEETSIELQRWR
jgi:hypothetical protein